MNLKQIGLTLIATLGTAQTPAPPDRLQFGVASIKQNTIGGSAFSRRSPGGQFSANNIAISVLIQLAYNVEDFQISGGPAWINSQRFDVTAKAEGDATVDQMRSMLKSLLADRLKMMLHRETKNLPVYDLVAAKGGIKFVATQEGSCTTFNPSNPLPPPPRPGEALPRMCGAVRMSRTSLDAVGITMLELALELSHPLRRLVADKTRLAGTFDVHLEFSPEFSTDDVAASISTKEPLPTVDSAPSIFTALQDQLGLRLEPAKAPVEVIVIDHVERPSEN